MSLKANLEVRVTGVVRTELHYLSKSKDDNKLIFFEKIF